MDSKIHIQDMSRVRRSFAVLKNGPKSRNYRRFFLLLHWNLMSNVPLNIKIIIFDNLTKRYEGLRKCISVQYSTLYVQLTYRASIKFHWELVLEFGAENMKLKKRKLNEKNLKIQKAGIAFISASRQVSPYFTNVRFFSPPPSKNSVKRLEHKFYQIWGKLKGIPYALMERNWNKDYK